MNLKLKSGFRERVQARFDRFSMEVGVLQNDEHREPRERPPGADNFGANLGSYAGGPVRKVGPSGSATIAEVSKANRDRLDINFYLEPFKKDSPALQAFMKSFFIMASGRASSMKRRTENALQAVVRNPILRGEYGKQARSTTKAKGFYRPMIDTAQLFKAIKAIVKVKG